MFPDSQNLSSNSDSIMSDDSVLLHTNYIPMPRAHDETKLSVSSSGREGSLTLIPSSPISSSGSPVWAPELSPMRFVADILPTPKLFYRQKMF
ncbi:hypothetical protein AVEN_172460-1 [Araneus ventricosus]|nr:hypothetical protein AVEN_172460-1 [Araneus ventricosus]